MRRSHKGAQEPHRRRQRSLQYSRTVHEPGLPEGCTQEKGDCSLERGYCEKEPGQETIPGSKRRRGPEDHEGSAEDTQGVGVAFLPALVGSCNDSSLPQGEVRVNRVGLMLVVQRRETEPRASL